MSKGAKIVLFSVLGFLGAAVVAVVIIAIFLPSVLFYMINSGSYSSLDCGLVNASVPTDYTGMEKIDFNEMYSIYLPEDSEPSDKQMESSVIFTDGATRIVLLSEPEDFGGDITAGTGLTKEQWNGFFAAYSEGEPSTLFDFYYMLYSLTWDDFNGLGYGEMITFQTVAAMKQEMVLTADETSFYIENGGVRGFLSPMGSNGSYVFSFFLGDDPDLLYSLIISGDYETVLRIAGSIEEI